MNFISKFRGFYENEKCSILLYSGNEAAARRYFDMVWDARKPGKDKFKKDFLAKLNESAYWREMLADNR